jgi:hypothetical protein
MRREKAQPVDEALKPGARRIERKAIGRSRQAADKGRQTQSILFVILTDVSPNSANERDKKDGGGIDAEKPDCQEECVVPSLLMTSKPTIRRRGGSAADFTVYPNGSVAQSSESYGAGGKGAGEGPTPTPKAPVTPATPTGCGRGGRGNVPPPVQTAPQGKTMTTADLQDYANDHTNGNLAAARKIFTSKGWTILP